MGGAGSSGPELDARTEAVGAVAEAEGRIGMLLGRVIGLVPASAVVLAEAAGRRGEYEAEVEEGARKRMEAEDAKWSELRALSAPALHRSRLSMCRDAHPVFDRVRVALVEEAALAMGGVSAVMECLRGAAALALGYGQPWADLENELRVWWGQKETAAAESEGSIPEDDEVPGLADSDEEDALKVGGAESGAAAGGAPAEGARGEESEWDVEDGRRRVAEAAGKRARVRREVEQGGSTPVHFVTLTTAVYQWEDLHRVLCKYDRGTGGYRKVGEGAGSEARPFPDEPHEAKLGARMKLATQCAGVTAWFCALKLELMVHRVLHLGYGYDDFYGVYEWGSGGIVHVHVLLWKRGLGRFDGAGGRHLTK